MKSIHRTILFIVLGIAALGLAGCGTAPAAPAAPDPTPAVEIGYLIYDNYSRMPAAFVVYEPGMTISAAYSPPVEDNSARHSLYKETITYASGKSTEVEFFVVRSDAEGTEYEAAINGSVVKVPDIKDYLTNSAAEMEDKMAFTFFPNSGGWQQPLMQLPPLCEEPGEMHQELSTIDGKEWLNSLDSITMKCPASGTTTTFTFSYVREEGTEPYIREFTVTIEEKTGRE